MANEKRLIDANEAIEKINCLCVNGNENWIGTDNQSFVDHADVVDILSDMPTVDAVEVVHGRWIDKREIPSYSNKNIPVVECSKCRCLFCDIINVHSFMYHYCPNCGAKMDGDGNG